LFKTLRRYDLVKERFGFFGGEIRFVEDRLHPTLKPLPLDLVGDVHVLHAERAAVGLAEFGEEVADGAVAGPEEAIAAALAVEVFQGEAEFGKLKERMRRAVVAKRIEVGD